MDEDMTVKAFKSCISDDMCEDCPLLMTDCGIRGKEKKMVPTKLLQSVSRLLDRYEPIEAEIEGDCTRYYVCGECHDVVQFMDHYCPNCGRRLSWE